jgi:nitrogen fixation NifU-like protein
MERFRRPLNRGTLAHPTVSQEGHNPLCGDRVRFDMLLVGDTVREARFNANACAICIAAADLLADLVRDAPLDEVETLTVQDLMNVLKSPIPAARMNCVKLPLTVMHIGIQNHRDSGLGTRDASGTEPGAVA